MMDATEYINSLTKAEADILAKCVKTLKGRDDRIAALEAQLAALKSENADLRLSIDDIVDFVSNLYPHMEDEMRYRVRLIFYDDDKMEIRREGE